MKKPDIVSQDQYDFVILESLTYGINPYLIFAIGIHETGWGTKGWGKHGYILGVGCYSENKANERFKGFEAQIKWAANAISKHMSFRITHLSLENFAKYVWKPADPSVWASGVFWHYKELINNYAPEIPICAEPPAWVVPALKKLYVLGVVNTPFGDLDFYRTCQVAANMIEIFSLKRGGFNENRS